MRNRLDVSVCFSYPRGKKGFRMPSNSLNQVKNRIRAVLISAKHGCSPRQLLNDYEHFIGEPIPYEELGFGNFMEFLRSIPDAVCIVRSRDRTTLHGVPDAKNQHIAKMVSKQRDHPSRAGFDGHGHPRMSMIVPSGKSIGGSTVSKAPQVPSTFRVQLRSLLLSYPNGIALADFSEAFARRFAYYCNYKSWGFKTLEEVLRSVNDVITLELDPVRKTLVVKRAVATTLKRSQSVGTAAKQVTTRSTSVKVPSKPPAVDSLHSIELSPKQSSALSSRLASAVNGTSRQSKGGKLVTKKLIGQVEELLKANPSGLWLSQFSFAFKDHFKEDLPVTSLGFTSASHLLSSIPVCSIERPSTGLGDWLVYSATKPEPPKVAPDHAVKPEAYLSNDLMESIQSLLRRYRDGISLKKFSKTFSETFHRDLPLQDLGFHSEAELLQKVRGVMVYKPPDSSEVMVYGTMPSVEKDNKSSGTNLDSSTSQSFTKNSAYAKQPLPKKARMCPVYVTYVKTPSYLVVQLLGEKTTKALEYLLEDITQFYNSRDGDGYRIEKTCVGEPCCATFNNDGYWYRAEVIAIQSSDIIEVMYVDYGNSAVVPLSSVRRPKPHYLTLPAQAVQCRLANLKPAGSTWNRMSSRILTEMTKDKPIVAIITAIKSDVMSVCLCDTNTERDLHVNDTLVDQGLALFSPDSQEDQANGFDEYQLESVPVGSTGDKVPKVRLPEGKGQVASAPPPAPTSKVPPSLTQPIMPPLAQSTMPSLQIPTVSQMTQLQLQNYLQQLLLLQQQHNALLMNQSANPVFQTGQTGFQAGQMGLQSPLGLQPFVLNPVYPFSTGVTPANPAEPAKPTATQDPLNLNSISTDSSDSTSTRSESLPPSLKSPPPHSTSVPAPPTAPSVRDTPTPVDNGASKNHGVSDGEGSNRTSRSTSVEAKSSRSTSCEVETRSTAAGRGSGGGCVSTDAKNQLIKRVTLTGSHSISVLRHKDKAYFMSCEVSEWFWESDLLKTMLRQVQQQVWGLLLMEKKAHKLFTALRNCPDTARFVEYENQLTLYALDDLPLIVTTFHAPLELCSAVSREVEKWKSSGVDYFSDDSEKELKMLETTLKNLQAQRKELLVEMMGNSNDEPADGKAPLEKLIVIEREIAEVKNKLSKLKQVSPTPPPPQAVDDTQKPATEGCQSSEREMTVEERLESEPGLTSSSLQTTAIEEDEPNAGNDTGFDEQLDTKSFQAECSSWSRVDNVFPDEGVCNDSNEELVEPHFAVNSDVNTALLSTDSVAKEGEIDSPTFAHITDLELANEETQFSNDFNDKVEIKDNFESGATTEPFCLTQKEDVHVMPMVKCGNKMRVIDDVASAMIPVQHISPYAHPQSFVPQRPLAPTPVNSTRRPPFTSGPVGIGRGLSKGSVPEKPRSIGIGRGISRGRKPGTQPKPTSYRDDEGREWQIVSHSRKNYIQEIPPMGSGAGLDII